MFLFNYVSVFITIVCLRDIDDTVKNNTIIVLINYEGIAIIETINGADARERNCEMLIAFIVFDI